MRFILVLTSILFSSMAFSSDTGKELYERCSIAGKVLNGDENILNNSDNAVNFGVCLGVLVSIRDMNIFLKTSGDKHFFCPPQVGITNGEAVQIFMQYVDKNPGIKRLAQTGVVLHAFKEKFPCK